MSDQKRLLALMLCISLVFVLFTSSAYIAHEADHDCTGEECEICENIAQMEVLLRSFTLLGVVLLALFALLTVHRVCFAAGELRAYAAPTLVGWKVRLNN